MDLSMIAGTAALVMVFSSMAAKLMITQLLSRLKRQISQVAQIKQDSLNRLKSAQSHKAIMEKNKSMLERKKTKLAKKLSHIKQELAGVKEEESARRQRVQSRRVT